MNRMFCWVVCIFAQVLLLNSKTQAATAAEDQETNDLLNWEAPYTLRKNFPYFLSGYDFDGCPVWVIELGKWGIRNQLEAKLSTSAEFRKYSHQFITTMYESPERQAKKPRNDTNPNNETLEYCPEEEFNMLIDLDGYSNRQLANLPALTAIVTMSADFLAINTRRGLRMKKAVAVNLNFVAQRAYDLVKPVIGQLAERTIVFGTNQEKWRRELFRIFPKETLPEFLGGSSDHIPVQIYG